jgi:hypothetical protein
VRISDLYIIGGKGDSGESKAKGWAEKQGDFENKLDADATAGSACGTTELATDRDLDPRSLSGRTRHAFPTISTPISSFLRSMQKALCHPCHEWYTKFRLHK